MSRHQGVYNMIKHGDYNDDDYEEEEVQQEEEDQYGDHNFTMSELKVINYLCEIFILDFTRKQIIDALYETDGDQDAAVEYLSNKIKKTQKSSQPKKQVQQQQPIQQLPQLIKQQNSIDKSKSQFHIEYDVNVYNSPYPEINNKQIQNKSISIVIMGHVDTGKSTLTGRLLQQFKSIDEKEIRKNAKEAKNMGKDTSALAYATDQTKEEKEKGVTMDSAYKSINVNGRVYNLIDSPGHQDFTPNLLMGAAQADYALLVIDTTKNALENSIKSGQLKEKIILIKAMSIKKIIITLNKMDQINWDKVQFDYAKDIIQQYFNKLGYLDNQLIFIPISAYQGQNIIKKYDNKWYNGKTLVEELENLESIQKQTNLPLRYTILNKYHQNEGKLRGTCLFGKLNSGIIDKNKTYVILPQGIYCEIKEYEQNEGDMIEMKIKTQIDIEFQNIILGSILSSIDYHVPVANKLICQISTLDLITPIIRGSQFLMHLGAQKMGVVVKKLNHIYNNKMEIKKKFPRAIISNEIVEIELECDNVICVETQYNLESLSRIVLREKFNIIGIGNVTLIQMNMNKIKQSKVIHEQQI